MSKYDFLSKVDLTNAFYSLSKETLDSNITQVYTPERCVRFLAPITGMSNKPLFWGIVVNQQLNMDDHGLFDPLSTNTTNFKFWVDDFLISSVGTLQKYMNDVE